MSDDDMSPRRKRVITSLFAAFIAAHLVALATGDQHWPVMSFPMFSFNFAEGMSCTVAYGVPADAAKQEFRLMPPQVGLAGLTLTSVFNKMVRYPERSPMYDRLAAECGGDTATRECVAERLERGGLRYLYARYEAQRRRNPKLPPLRALRLYDMRFVASPRIYDPASKQLRLEWAPETPP